MSSRASSTSRLTSALCDYARETETGALLLSTGERMTDALVNWVGCALAGSNSDTVNAAVAAIGIYSEGGRYAALGRSERFGLPDAIMLDCLSSASFGFDDAHLETILHPTGPVAAALLGLSQVRPINGEAFLAALAVGMEVQCRVALAITAPSTGGQRGWYPTGLVGGIGAAAAVGRVLGLDRMQMLAALGLAAARAGGNRGTLGSMACAYVPAAAAESGFAAAMLAATGFTCDAATLDGPNGLLALVTREPALDRALSGLGTEAEVLNNTYKPYPCGILIHPIIDACLEFTQRHGPLPAELEGIEFNVSTAAFSLCALRHPSDPQQAQVSLYHWAAVALIHGAAGVQQGLQEEIDDTRTVRLRQRIVATETPGIPVDACFARFQLKDGSRIDIEVAHALGSLQKPMSSSNIDAKFLALCYGVVAPDLAEAMLTSCRRLRAMTDVGTELRRR